MMSDHRRLRKSSTVHLDLSNTIHPDDEARLGYWYDLSVPVERLLLTIRLLL
jgi:hypothetical protein